MALDHQGFAVSPSHTLADFDNSLLTYGGFAVTGPQIDLDPDPIDSFIVSSFQFEGYIAKYAQSDGSLIWATGVGGGVNADLSINLLALDKSFNHLIAGQLFGTVDLDFGSNVVNESNSNNSSATLLIQYDSAFAYVQHLKFESVSDQSWISINSIESDFQNNYYLLGSYSDTVDFDPGPNQSIQICDSGRAALYLAKYDQQFNLVWVDTFSSQLQMGPNFSIEFMNYDPVSGQIILCGNYSGTDTIDLDPEFGQALLYNDFDECSFTAVYDTAGHFIRMRKTFSAFANNIDGVALDNSGYIYQLVDFEDTLYLQNPFVAPYLVSQFPDAGYGIVKYDINGTYISSAILYSDFDPDFNRLLVKDGNVYVSGTLSGPSLDVDPSAAVQQIFAFNESYFLLCYKASLGMNSFVWGFSDPNSSSENHQFCIASDHTLYVSGTFEDSLDCDPSSATNYLYAPVHGYNFHIAYDSTTITSIIDRIDVLKDFIYPNPVKDYLKISVPIQKDMQATILSMQGDVMLTTQSLQNEEEIHIEKLSAGMYLLNLKSSSGSQIFKFIKTH